MKAAAEAIKNPEKGDVWEKGDYRRIIIERVKRAWDCDRDKVFYSGRNCRELKCSYRTFRGWCQGAEYLGREK